MKRRAHRALCAVAAGLVFAAAAAAQEKKEEYDMGVTQLVLLSRAPDWKAEAAAPHVEKAQRAYVEKLIEDGTAALAGSVEGEGDLREVLVFKTDSPELVSEWVANSPAVKAGVLKSEVLKWYTARNYITPPRRPLTRTAYVFGILLRGPKWTAQETEETKKIQAGHMANIGRLSDAGKLVLAGPFEGGGERRGVFIFKVPTLEEAQRLTDTDPAVAAGRLKVQLYKWSVPAGMLR
jgi:uncharacterized protein YciI